MTLGKGAKGISLADIKRDLELVTKVVKEEEKKERRGRGEQKKGMNSNVIPECIERTRFGFLLRLHGFYGFVLKKGSGQCMFPPSSSVLRVSR